ncbi:phospholipid carrier-dependent glycosyltransferase [Lentisphaerota bacterium ZTH]|nr:phospholipid carrier-dependent glycosyltransferase [Lentisphaerota bacterium]WET07273.1 phospholipid carrier-dependent glycosyltransferase [Lentisphaerota bacterium ZTH]
MNRKNIIILLGVFVLLYFGTIWFRPLYTPDETRYAEMARELIVHHDWVVPKLNNLKYFEKPIMGHWLNALSLVTFGQNVFAVRFASALSVLLSAAFLFWLVARVRSVAFAGLSCVVYLTSAIVFGVGTYSVLDSFLSLYIAATLGAFYLAWRRNKFDWQKIALLALAGIACGGAFLVKGFLAFAIPGLTILAFLIWEKRWKDIFILPWIPLLFVIITAGPWSYLVYKRAPDFWSYFFFVEHWQRFAADVESQHPEPFWYFIPVIIGGALPWILLLPGILKGYRKKWKEAFSEPLMKYMACWLVFPFILFSASSGKLATYILPCFPAVAVLLAWGLERYFSQNEFKWFDWTVKILAGVLVFGVFGIAVAEIIYFAGLVPKSLYMRGEIFKWLLASFTLLIWAAFLLKAWRQKEGFVKFGWFTAATLTAMFAFHFIVPGVIENKKAPCPWLAQFKDRITPETIVVSYKNLASSVCWEFKRDNVYIYHKGGELTYGLKHAKTDRLLDQAEIKAMIDNPANHVVVIMNSKKRAAELPTPQFRDKENGMYFQEYNAK